MSPSRLLVPNLYLIGESVIKEDRDTKETRRNQIAARCVTFKINDTLKNKTEEEHMDEIGE